MGCALRRPERFGALLAMAGHHPLVERRSSVRGNPRRCPRSARRPRAWRGDRLAPSDAVLQRTSTVGIGTCGKAAAGPVRHLADLEVGPSFPRPCDGRTSAPARRRITAALAVLVLRRAVRRAPFPGAQRRSGPAGELSFEAAKAIPPPSRQQGGAALGSTSASKSTALASEPAGVGGARGILVDPHQVGHDRLRVIGS